MFTSSKVIGLSVAAAAVGLLGLSVPQARADVILYATGNAGQTAGKIYQVDVTTSAITATYSTPSGDEPDSIIFANASTLLYTNYASGVPGVAQLSKINANGSGYAVQKGGLTGASDLTLMPDGTDVLVSGLASNTIYKITNALTAPVLSTFHTYAGQPDPQGIVFTPNGNLYVNIGTRDTGTNMRVEQLDPGTGAPTGAASALYPALDGLTFDPFTGMLFATERNSNKLLEIDPSNLSGTGTELPILDSSGAAMTIAQLDGIESDGVGDLFIASNSTQLIYEYNIATGKVIWTSPIIGGLDDIVPLTGLGSGTPEPASLSLLGVGLGGLMLRRRRR